ncbi:hypothetical protein POM88_002036 [Heracleum sosnowskyi]|uniref:Glutaredoxin domain-containing protein n=1 Tax=Heracleum sosnowskyi TaxID=360622 RepID=A0AAD8JH05_9APIA|nr:hypothetical protein POM88_002036 [Heracleum sosnowskyi]
MLQIVFNKWKNPKPTCFGSIVSLKEAGLILSDEHLESTNNNYKESQANLLNEPEFPKQRSSKDFYTLKDVASFFPAKPIIESDSESSSDSEELNYENRRIDADDKSRKLPPSDAEEIVQSWPANIISESRKRVVVFMTSFPLSNSVFEACKTVRLIFMRLGVMVEELDMLMDSTFINELQRIRQVDGLSLPRVFIGGRYVGGVDEVKKLNESRQLKKFVQGLPEREHGVCEDCGGYRFLLCNSTQFRTCTACNDNDLNSVLGSGETKLRICFRARDEEYKYVYLIYSVDGSWLANQRSNPPTLNRDAVIFGHHSMGCGAYDSTIFFAGRPRDMYDHSYFISYDMKEDNVSYKPLLPFWALDASEEPLVFQLNQRLFVYNHEETVKFCSPVTGQDWITSRISKGGPSDDREKCSCLVVGNSCCISSPIADVTFIHHCNDNDMQFDSIHDSDASNDEGLDWTKHSNASLPFSGHATFYHQDGFDDFVIIYFENGAVRVFPFDFFSFGESQVLFVVDSCTVGGTMHGYFADFGKGCFCLAASNNSFFYLYTFVITRYGKQSDPLKVQAKILSRYNFEFQCFCPEGYKIQNIVGCFAPAPNREANLYAEEVAARTRLKK